MTNDTKETGLQTIFLHDEYWSGLAAEVRAGTVTFAEQVERQGYALADAVVDDGCGLTVKQFKQFVKQANILDGEATRYLAGNGAASAEAHCEGDTRRLMHHAGKAVLAMVGYDNIRIGYRNRRAGFVRRNEKVTLDERVQA